MKLDLILSLDRVKQLEERIDKAKTEKELDAYLDSVNKLPNGKEKTALLNSIDKKRKSIKPKNDNVVKNASSTHNANKFGTPENPDFVAIFFASSKEDLEAALELLDALPDTNPLKKTYRNIVDSKLARIKNASGADNINSTANTGASSNSPKRNVVKKADVNINDLSKTEKAYEFKDNPWDKTEIEAPNGILQPEEVGFGNWLGGYGTRTSIYVEDIRSHNRLVSYNERTNSTIINIDGKRIPGWPRSCDSLIRVQGKVSEQDAKALIAYLDKNVKDFRGELYSPVEVQKFVAEFFNNL